MSTIAGSPAMLRSRSASLHGHARSLRSASVRIRGAGTKTAVVWRGAASLQHLARSAQVTAGMGGVADEVETVARATGRYADHLEQAQQGADALERRRRACREELEALLHRSTGATAGAPDGAVVPEVQRRIEALRVEIGTLEGRIASVRDELDGRQHLYAWMLQEAAAALPPEARVGLEVGTGAGQVLKGIRALGRVTVFLRHLHGTGTGTPADRAARAGKAAEMLRTLQNRPTAAQGLGRGMLRRLDPFGVVWKAGNDLATGGGYDGWRGGLTRYYAGGAVVGAVALNSRHPVAVAVGAVLIGGWGLWKGGNALWDNRQAIVRFAAKVWRGAGKVARSAGGRAARLLVSPGARARRSAKWISRRVRELANGKLPFLPDRFQTEDVVPDPREVVEVPRWLESRDVPPAVVPIEPGTDPADPPSEKPVERSSR